MTRDNKKKEIQKKKKLHEHESECVQLEKKKNTLALELDRQYMCTVSVFIAMYLLCSSPLQKCVLTLDDVMLQVQRIYVNRGSRGGGIWGGGEGRDQKLPDITRFIYSLNEKAIMQHLKDCTGKRADPMLDAWNLLMIRALPLKNGAERGPPSDLRAALV